MPFTLDGQWIPSKQPDKKPTQIRVVKRGNNTLTIIEHLSGTTQELEQLAASLKKKLGCGGTLKEDSLEIQGNKADAVKKHLLSLGMTCK